MKTSDKIELLSRLKCVLNDVSQEKKWDETDNGLSELYYNQFVEVINREHIYNGWFTKANILKALNGIASWLDKLTLENWINGYENISSKNAKTVGIIMAGNIPLVGFHDFLSVFLSGHIAAAKLSSDDARLFPEILKILSHFNGEISNWVQITEKLSGFDAVIATGSNNSATYFNSYFEKYPNIIRKNRTSVAVLTGNESKDDLKKLGKDIFDYFGLGCRNVTQLIIPRDFDLNRFFEAIFEFDPIINHNKYANNYDYNKAVYLLNLQELLDNGFILLKEDDTLNSPLGVLYYKRYDTNEEVEAFLTENADQIQAVIGQDYIGFGESQCPGLTDYADGVDTMTFLTNL